jgi:hypothetical protein
VAVVFGALTRNVGDGRVAGRVSGVTMAVDADGGAVGNWGKVGGAVGAVALVGGRTLHPAGSWGWGFRHRG